MATGISKERKYATVLFADLVGYTTLVERQDPEVVESIVGRALRELDSFFPGLTRAKRGQKQQAAMYADLEPSSTLG